MSFSAAVKRANSAAGKNLFEQYEIGIRLSEHDGSSVMITSDEVEA